MMIPLLLNLIYKPVAIINFEVKHHLVLAILFFFFFWQSSFIYAFPEINLKAEGIQI